MCDMIDLRITSDEVNIVYVFVVVVVFCFLFFFSFFLKILGSTVFEFAYVLIVSILLNDEKVIEKRNKRKNKHLFIIENKMCR